MKNCIYGSEIGPLENGVFVGGAAVSAVRLARVLHDLGDKIFIYSSSPRGRHSGFYEFDWGFVVNKWIPGRYMSLPYLFLYSLVSFFGLLNFCKRNKIDIISSHSGHLIACIIPSIVGKILKIPVVHVQYSTLTFGFKRIFRFFSNPTLTRMFLTFPTMFVAISNNVAYSLLNSGLPKHKLEVIPPVVFSSEDDSRLKYDCRKLIGISEDDFVALFVGNLRENKGIDVLVDSLGTLAYRFRKLKVVVTTELLQNSFDERKRSLVERIEKHELTDRVVWLGIVENMPELMKVADVVMVPFLNLEGISDYPLVVLEAMITGTPVIASDIGGIREIIKDGETGILVSPGNVKALAQALQSLIVNPKLRNRLANNSYAMFHEIYKKEEIAQQYRHLFVACKGRLSR